MDYAIVKDEPGLKRDMSNGTLVSTPEHLEIYRIQKAKKIAERDREREFRRLQHEVADMKALIVELLERLPKPSE